MSNLQRWGITALLIVVAGCSSMIRERRSELSCEGPITRSTTRADLVATFGIEHISDEEIEVGEGETVGGTVIHPDAPFRRIEIVWSNSSRMNQVASVRVSEPSDWLVEGLESGLDLRTVERMNERPFSLHGFDWDYAGTIASWNGGRFERGAECRLLARFRPPDGVEIDGVTLSGEELHSSDDPGMRDLNPRIYELLLLFE